MNGTEISPKYSAELPSNIYIIKDIDGQGLFKLKYKNDLEIGDQSMVRGRAGALIILKKTRVGAVFAKGTGKYKGQVLKRGQIYFPCG